MPQYTYLNLDSAAYDVFSGVFSSVDFTEREMSIISTMMFLLTERDSWDDMTDAEWDVQEEEIQNIIDRLTP